MRITLPFLFACLAAAADLFLKSAVSPAVGVWVDKSKWKYHKEKDGGYSFDSQNQYISAIFFCVKAPVRTPMQLKDVIVTAFKSQYKESRLTHMESGLTQLVAYTVESNLQDFKPEMESFLNGLAEQP